MAAAAFAAPRRGRRRGAAAVVSGSCLAAAAAAALPLGPLLVAGARRAPGQGPRPRAQCPVPPRRVGLRRLARRGSCQPLSAFLSGTESPFNDGDLDTLCTVRDVEGDDLWPSGDDSLAEAIEDLRREDERRKAHAQRSGHTPVQELEAVDKVLVPTLECEDSLKNDGVYVDGTFGRGGHSRSILGRLSPRGRLFAFDVDPVAVAAGRELERQDPRFHIFHRPFGEMREALRGVKVNGVLLDVGVSNPQVDEDGRGFKLSPDAPLDLRMNQQRGIPAAEWLQSVSVEELAWVIHEYGETKDAILAERIAESVLARQRRLGPYTSAGELADVVKVAKGVCAAGLHPAKLTFQAIRIHLNHELDQLRQALEGAFELLTLGGRCVVISFKSLESDVAVRFLREHEDAPPEVVKMVSQPRLCELYPLVRTDLNYSVRRMSSPFVRPRGAEYLNNHRSRSSILITLIKAARWAHQVRAPARPLAERFKRPRPPPFQGAAGAEESS